MSHNATSLTSWAKAMKLTLDQSGVDSKSLFEQAGLDFGALDDPNARYPMDKTTVLWQLAIEATQNRNFGFDVSRNINQTTFHALGYSLMASPTIGDCFERMVRYFRIFSDEGEIEFYKEGANYKFVIHPLPGEQQPTDEGLEAMMAVIIRLCRILSGREFNPVKASFRRSQPQDSSVFEKIFRSPIEFAAEETALYFDVNSVQKKLPAANAELARHNDEILARHLTRFDKQNIVNQVYAALVEQLPLGEPSQEKVANILNVSMRNLQRKLGALDMPYKDILNKARRDLALSYIADSNYSISEITYLLGFSDTSSFTRAFKRWTGMSPSDYRNKK